MPTAGELLDKVMVESKTSTITIGGTINQSVVVEGPSAIIKVTENTVITANIPIQYIGEGSLTIQGEPDVTLKLVCTETRQPCIGTKAHTNMSYDRWCVDYTKYLQKLVIDGVKVICESPMQNIFTIGTYNVDEVCIPIQCINNGHIECPEMRGTRRLVEKAYPPNGSTKISSDPYYVIQNDNGTIELSKEQRQILKEARTLGLDVRPLESGEYSTSTMETLVTYMRWGVDLSNLEQWPKEWITQKRTYLGALLVGVPYNEPRLLEGILSMRRRGILAEMDIDLLKRLYAHKKMWPEKASQYAEYFEQKGVLNYENEYDRKIKNEFKIYMGKLTIEMLDYMSESEKAFWWQLIPCEEYISGSTDESLIYYYNGSID